MTTYKITIDAKDVKEFSDIVPAPRRKSKLPLTERQKEVIEAILHLQSKKGYAPTNREIGELINMKSTSTVYSHLSRLKERGYIDYVDFQARTLKVLDKYFEETGRHDYE